jgi:heptosyltransferase-3
MLNFILQKIFNLLIHGRVSLGAETFDPGHIRRILVVRNDNVGDVLCSTPGIRALRRAFPSAYIAALVVKYSQDAITGNPDLDEIFVYEKAKHRPDRNLLLSLYRQFQVERRLRRARFDLAIGMRSSFSWSEAWLVYFTGATVRLGYEPGPRGRRFAFFYNLRVPSRSQGHEVEKVLHLLATIGVSPAQMHLTVTIPEEDRKIVDFFLREKRIDPLRLVGFHLSARVPANRWSPENFASLAARLHHAHGQFIVLTWGPGDERQAEKVRNLAGKGVYAFPTPHFKRLGALQERCRVFLSPDGGPMHFAVAVGTPTIGLFGKTDPRMWAPWGNSHVTLWRGVQADSISVDEVYQAMKKWIVG